MRTDEFVGEKEAIRKSMSRQRSGIAPDKAEVLGRRAQENVTNSTQFRAAASIGAYYAIGSEAKTNMIIDEAFRLGKVVALPRTDKQEIRFYEFLKGDELVPGKYGIKEPLPTKPADDLNLIVVPGLAFDRTGHRLGYGKGYYDNYLRNAKGFSIGLGFSFQLLNRLPTDIHDVRLKGLATDNGINYF